MTRADRPIDVLVWGATGFTGRLVAEYLARRPAGDVRWAIGGRDRGRLERVRDDLVRLGTSPELPIVVGDANDATSMDAVARQARVVATTVGPFARYGRELMAACARHGTDYCDITGEVPFVRDAIDAHDARARETGARLVPCCGFDSIPSDLGTLMLQEHARAEHAGRCREVRCFAGESRGGISGGTAASMLGIAESAARDRRIRTLLLDPYALDPPGGERGPDGADPRGVRWEPAIQQWTGPFVMAQVNSRVVRRSHALLGHPWGKDFRYREAASFGRGPAGWGRAAGMTAGLAAAVAVLASGLGRRLAGRWVPAPGEGPSRELRERGFFVVRLVGEGEGERGAFRLLGEVRGTSDPGYGETAKMLAESALTLALDGARIRQEGGVLTPASCLGVPLIERLREAGMTFAVRDAGE